MTYQVLRILIIKTCHGLAMVALPGPSNHLFVLWAAARPGLNVHSAGCGPSNVQIWRPGPAHDIDSEPPQAQAIDCAGRPHFRGPACGFEGPGHGPAHVSSRMKR